MSNLSYGFLRNSWKVRRGTTVSLPIIYNINIVLFPVHSGETRQDPAASVPWHVPADRGRHRTLPRRHQECVLQPPQYTQVRIILFFGPNPLTLCMADGVLVYSVCT